MNFSFPVIETPAFVSEIILFLTSTSTLLVVFFLFLVIYFIVTCVLMYHWSRYGMGHSGIFIARTLFLVVSIFLFVSAFLALQYY